MTRADRRRMRRHADRVAAFLAATCLHDDAGARRWMDGDLAFRVVRDGFAAMLRDDCRPVVKRLADAEARALPGWRPTPPGAVWWLACGLDVERRGTWVTNWTLAVGLPEAEAADAVEVMMLERLAEACNKPGLPAGWEA